MMEVPTQPVPVQQVKATLGGQNCQIGLYQKEQGMFADVNVDGVDVALCVSVLNAVPLVPAAYSGFAGNLFVIDTQGADDPYYTIMGSRFALVYLTAAEYALVN